jgi:predicted nucleic acid-binding protein
MSPYLVSNTGPVIAFSLIKRLDILHALFPGLVIPEVVHQEILEGGAAGLGLGEYRNATWIQVRALRRPLDPLLETVLHAGEAAVIQLALELSSERVLIDEQKARKIARAVYGLRVIGSARVLVEAKRRGLLPDVGDALERMREGGYWIGDPIVALALREADEA